MEANPPVPVVKTLLVCRELFVDNSSKEVILVGPLLDLHVPQIPTVVHVSVFFELTSGHGDYVPTLQLRDLDEQVVWYHTYDQPFPAQDPLRIITVQVTRIGVCIPRYGKYDWVLLVNKQEIGRRPLLVVSSANSSSP